MIVVTIKDKRYNRGRRLEFFNTDFVTSEIIQLVSNNLNVSMINATAHVYTREEFLQKFSEKARSGKEYHCNYCRYKKETDLKYRGVCDLCTFDSTVDSKPSEYKEMPHTTADEVEVRPSFQRNVAKFLDEIQTISRKYDLSISHEDSQGSFIIEEFNVYNLEWLRQAQVKINGGD